MSLKIEILNLGEYEAEWSRQVQYKTPGRMVRTRIVSYLILGSPEGPILVDTGFRQLPGSDRPVTSTDAHSLEMQLDRFGLKPADIRYIIHTHLHSGHCGRDDIFPTSSTVVVNRRELEVGCSGLDCDDYAAVDMKHLIDRVHTQGAAWLLDLDSGSPVEIVEGVSLELSGGHTEGSANVLVETEEGTAVICGDLVFHVHEQLVDPMGQVNHREPRISGSMAVSQVAERTALKKALSKASWLLPMHDGPARVAPGGLVIGRVTGTSIPGPVTELEAFRTT
ncbi:MBL fold metallo-hydrolase [Rhizobium sp. NZLR11]|uniref:MBL fold metallo-hydrolase n=1 Tax=Rhizobium sp. NZLR11 TaxID=2731098 RepID=UPI001C83C07B|nr:MBL fold metallo-hydrolase [Rhizobium sp. NZLR11]MBX5210469.1 MBL fold metallo-hydrolase [Rhizobium sp. NZLR11]